MAHLPARRSSRMTIEGHGEGSAPIDACCCNFPDAGRELGILKTPKERPSAPYLYRGSVRKQALSDRRRQPGCGFVATRDQASALSDWSSSAPEGACAATPDLGHPPGEASSTRRPTKSHGLPSRDQIPVTKISPSNSVAGSMRR